jgi:hypothetical protein
MIRHTIILVAIILCSPFVAGTVLRAYLFYGPTKDCAQGINSAPFKEVIINECTTNIDGNEMATLENDVVTFCKYNNTVVSGCTPENVFECTSHTLDNCIPYSDYEVAFMWKLPPTN